MKKRSVCGNRGVGEVVRVNRNKAPLIPIFLKEEKKVAMTNSLSSLTSVPSQISEHIIRQICEHYEMEEMITRSWHSFTTSHAGLNSFPFLMTELD